MSLLLLMGGSGGGGGGCDFDPLRSGLVHVFPLGAGTDDEADLEGGATLADTGTPSTVTGKHGDANTYSDSTEKHSGSVSRSLPVTVSFWFNANSSAGTGFFLFSGSGQDEIRCRYAEVSGTQRVVCEYGDSIPFQEFTAEATHGTWHHAVVRIDSTNIQLSLNGTHQSSAHGETADDFTTLTVHQINGNAAVTIDELYIWDRVLTDDECDDLYNSGTGCFWSPQLDAPADSELAADSVAVSLTAPDDAELAADTVDPRLTGPADAELASDVLTDGTLTAPADAALAADRFPLPLTAPDAAELAADAVEPYLAAPADAECYAGWVTTSLTGPADAALNAGTVLSRRLPVATAVLN